MARPGTELQMHQPSDYPGRLALVSIAPETRPLVIRRLHKATFPADAWDLAPTSRFWVARDMADLAVGFISVEPTDNDNDFFISRVGVVESARGQRIADKLLRHVERWAFEQTACDGLCTYVLPYNGASLKTFLRCGYDVYSPAWPWAGDGCVYFQKSFSRI